LRHRRKTARSDTIVCIAPWKRTAEHVASFVATRAGAQTKIFNGKFLVEGDKRTRVPSLAVLDESLKIHFF